MQIDDNQPRQNDESSQVEHTIGLYICVMYVCFSTLKIVFSKISKVKDKAGFKPGLYQPLASHAWFLEFIFVHNVCIYV